MTTDTEKKGSDMSTISLDAHAALAERIVGLRAERNRIAAELKDAEATLKGIMGDADTGTIGGVALFENTQGPTRTKIDTDALIASLSVRTVSRFAVEVAGRKSLRLVANAEDVLARFRRAHAA